MEIGIDSNNFFEKYRKYYGRLTKRQVDALNKFNGFVLADLDRFNTKEWAYIYATVVHETGFTFECVRESPRASEDWRKRNFRYYPYYGRGYVQITWERNYELFAMMLNVDLVKNPDLALVPENAFKILVIGSEKGLFTGKKLKGINFEKNYITGYEDINGKKEPILQLGSDYARRVINGTDKAKSISQHYNNFNDILNTSFFSY